MNDLWQSKDGSPAREGAEGLLRSSPPKARWGPGTRQEEEIRMENNVPEKPALYER